MNKVVLVGNLARDPEFRITQSGIACCSFTVACNRRYVNQQGTREADFINCVAWRQTAEFVNKYFIKGNKIGLVGTLQTRSYDAQDGSKRYVTEVLVDEVEFVTARQESVSPHREAAGQTNRQPQESPDEFTDVDDELPF